MATEIENEDKQCEVMNSYCLILALGLTLALTGCATNPVAPASARPVNPRRLLPDYALYSRPAPYGAKLVLVRDAAKLDAFERTVVMIDGRSVATLRPKERLDLYAFSGDHIMGLMSESGFLDPLEFNHSYVFKPGRTYYFRIGVANRSFVLKPVSRLD